MMILLFFILLLNGVFGDAGDVKSVSVVERENVTLYTHLTELRRDDLIVWTFGDQKTRIAQINQASNIICTDVQCEGADEGFRDRLKLDNQTGSLTIRDIRTKHSGLYTIKNYRTQDFYESFNVMVYARLPIPVINRNSSQCSKCVLLCSVMNVSHDVSLSWNKGNSLLSSISVSDINIRLSLPLEVEYQDTNTYSCVINNPITNLTQHLDINDVCQPCSKAGLFLGVIITAIVCVVVFVSVVGIGLYCWRTRKAKKKDTTDHGPGEESVPLKGTCFEKNVVKKVEVEEGTSVTLNTGETEIQGGEVVWWFGEAVNTTSSCVVIAKLNVQSEEECDNVDKRFKDKPQLDPHTGDLTITNSRTTDSGLYTLQMSREKTKLFSTQTSYKTFSVSVTPLTACALRSKTI
ncbi:hypothetical protein E1301_Tti013506 [Triplophysa tibetana]|uniref:Ig-like domain-containing protein n=1 Tax=Triplophysa tibetana TaxID=1572043 RepID=A0A5A9NP64_9TELE|nr:hypothetical protein E1301_Tti013506 [Triplophysa tibetana]